MLETLIEVKALLWKTDYHSAWLKLFPFNDDNSIKFLRKDIFDIEKTQAVLKFILSKYNDVKNSNLELEKDLMTQMDDINREYSKCVEGVLRDIDRLIRSELKDK